MLNLKICLLSTLQLSFAFFFALQLEAAVSPQHKTHAYYTHQPVLFEIVNKTTGPIIEFGCGYGTTDMLHELCEKTGRMLISLDDDLEWLTIFSEKYRENGYNDDNSGWHKFFHVAGRDLDHPSSPQHWIDFLQSEELLQNTFFDLCFIDQSPWLGRYETVKFMKGKAKYFIVHDCDFFPREGVFGKTILPILNRQPGIFDFSDTFKYYKVFFPLQPWPGDTGPPTLLGSDTESDLPDVDYTKY